MDWTLVIAAVLAAWAAVTLLGNERQRLLDTEAAAHPPTTADPATDAPVEPPIIGSDPVAPRRAA
ncbi:MAG TPA: hypothetical protein VF595_10770 [Tepidisphaeraceae bacterium]|jgi:hypothetical protein